MAESMLSCPGASFFEIDDRKKAEKGVRLQNIKTWIINEAGTLAAFSLELPSTNIRENLADCLRCMTEFTRLRPAYKKLCEAMPVGESSAASEDDVDLIRSAWTSVENLIRKWIFKLDNTLPDKLPELGRWLHEAEDFLRVEDGMFSDIDILINQVQEKLIQHRDYFKDVQKWDQVLTDHSQTGLHIELIKERLKIVSRRQSANATRMKCLLRQNHTETVTRRTANHLATKFIDKDQLQAAVQELQELEEMSDRQVKAYRKELGSENVEELVIFYTDASERWEQTKNNVHTACLKLRNTLRAWNNYTNSKVYLNNRLFQEPQVLSGDQRRIESRVKRHLSKLQEHGTLVIGNVAESVKEEIHKTLKKLEPKCSDFLQRKEIGVRDEINEKFEPWRALVCRYLHLSIPLIFEELNEHIRQLKDLKEEKPEVEDSTDDDTASTIALTTMQIQQRIDSLESLPGMLVKFKKYRKKLSRWVREGQIILDDHQRTANAENAKARLDKHEAFFSDTAYPRSLLEDMEADFQKISSKENVDISEIETSLNVKEEVEEIQRSAESWKRKLSNLARLWDSKLDKLISLETWFEKEQAAIYKDDELKNTEKTTQATESEESSSQLTVHVNIRSKKDQQKFLNDILEEFTRVVDPSRLRDCLYSEYILTDSDQDSLSGKGVNSRKAEARKLWVTLNKLSVENFARKAAPIIYQEYDYIVPPDWLVDWAPSPEPEQCLRHVITRRIRCPTMADALVQCGCLEVEDYDCIISQTAKPDEAWTMMFNTCRGQTAEMSTNCIAKVQNLLKKYNIAIPENLPDRLSQGLCCTCTKK